ncbi:olfactory receptor class A-like protein 1 [Protopterus annectens]|uniref:olfactory receptor class A-like protein 1 n=1 Tax=Protopterus annectens TaxID=7888 RepID=UPI001CFA50E9|nr:olfactory receptor class A-like protein 1 [Protopterus annectens]
MEVRPIIKGVISGFATTLGLTSNTVIVLALSSIAYKEKCLLPAETILFTLTGANLLLLSSFGIPHALFLLGVKSFYSDLGCKFDGHFVRSSRVMIIGLTCLLSCFQGATLASTHHTWAIIKAKMQKHLLLLIAFILTISTVTSLTPALYNTVNTNITGLKYVINSGYCLTVYPNSFLLTVNGMIFFARDVIFVILMAVASSYIIVTLHRHGKQMKGKRSSDRNDKNSAEEQAAKMVVTFVIIYVLVFGIENIIWFYQISHSEEGAEKSIMDREHMLRDWHDSERYRHTSSILRATK